MGMLVELTVPQLLVFIVFSHAVFIVVGVAVNTTNKQTMMHDPEGMKHDPTSSKRMPNVHPRSAVSSADVSRLLTVPENCLGSGYALASHNS